MTAERRSARRRLRPTPPPSSVPPDRTPRPFGYVQRRGLRRGAVPVGVQVAMGERRPPGVHIAAPSPLPPWWSFTPAETRVAELLAACHTHGEVAQVLGCSPKTVDAHVAHIGAALPGVGRPAERCAAFVAGVALWLARHPGEAPPASLLRDRTVPPPPTRQRS